jgi:hypothetical protein
MKKSVHALSTLTIFIAVIIAIAAWFKWGRCWPDLRGNRGREGPARALIARRPRQINLGNWGNKIGQFVAVLPQRRPSHCI